MAGPPEEGRAKAAGRPRLLLGVTKAEVGGAQRHVLDLAAGLRREFDVHVAAGSPGWLAEEAAALGLPVHVVPMDNGLGPWANLRAARQMRALVRRLAPALVHLHSTKMGFLGRLACRGLGVPVVFTAHGWGFGPGHGRARRAAVAAAERLAARWCQAIVTVSQADAALAARHGVGRPGQVRAIHNGVADGPVARPPAGPPRVAMLGRLAPPKDPVLLVEAAARLGAGAARPPLTFYGEGPLGEAVRERAAALGVAVRLVPPPHRDPWLAADVAVLASRAEGFPLVVLEAMRAGLPVVASDVGGVREAVADGATGFLVPPGDAGLLAQRLAQLAADPALRRRMGEAGRRRFEAEFRADRMVAATRALYGSLLAR